MVFMVDGSLNCALSDAVQVLGIFPIDIVVTISVKIDLCSKLYIPFCELCGLLKSSRRTCLSSDYYS